MDNIILQKTWVQGCPVIVDNLLGTAFTGEAQAHTFVVSGVDAAQEPVTITGTITGKFLAANNVTVPLTGSLVNGAASVTLTDECYDVPGRYILSIYATNGSTTQCLYCAVGNVFRTDSQTIAYPSTDLPNITTLMAQLEEILDGWPADYSQLQSDVSNLKSALTDEWGSIETIGFISKQDGINLLDVYADEIETGKYWVPTSNSFVTDANKSFLYIPVAKNADTYSFLGAVNVYGTSNVVKVPVFTSEKVFISHKYGTLDSETGIVTFNNLNTVLTTDTGYVGYSFVNDNKLAFFVKGEKTTTKKIEYPLDERIKITSPNKKNNSLYQRTAVFLGDSICAADTVPESDTDYYQYGWAGRIGVKNDMQWHNYGVSGGSITRITGRSCIQDRLAMAYANYPNADYFIFEGGTNDADVIGTGTPGYSKGTFEATNFSGTYDTATFCGSLETFIYNIISKYPDKKIGYIIPCKMGIDTGAFSNRRNYFDTAKQICEKWGISVIDVWEVSPLNPLLSVYYDSTKTDAQNIADGSAYVDGQHPTDVGYDIMLPIIESWMQNMGE